MTPPTPFEIGLYSFADLTPDPDTGKTITPTERINQLMETIELADQVGLDFFGLGEHHRPDFVSSAPTVILGAAAARTQNIRLSSAVTVLSSEDPVRVFQQFATLDLLSNGRAEIMAGRGSFIESFPLFGYSLNDYKALFVEKLEMLLAIRESEHVTWEGQFTQSLNGEGVYPRPSQDPLPVWIAVGGTPESFVRAGKLGLPLAVAIIGGYPAQFAGLVDLYRRAGAEAGHGRDRLKVSINSHGFLADSSQQAIDEAYPSFKRGMDKIGRERGWPPMSRAQFDGSTSLKGANHIGSVDDVIEKILYQHTLFGHQRQTLMLSIGNMHHDKVMHAIELLGTKVAPVVRAEIANRLSAETT